jgi:hypothetical protein
LEHVVGDVEHPEPDNENGDGAGFCGIVAREYSDGNEE